MAININRNINDPFYRYKMPRLYAKVEGKGNGIKTVIANMVEIARALERPPMYPTKYFGCELGAQVNADLKNDRYIVNGEHNAEKLQELLDGFIKKFVLCPACENPETSLFVKNQTIRSKCKACGHAYVIDGKHRLSAYILKNPPATNGVYDKEEKVDRKDNSPTESSNGFDFKENVTNGHNHEDTDEDDWAEPTHEEKLAAHISKLVMDKDLDKSEDERLDMLHRFFQAAKTNGTIGNTRAMIDEAERLELKAKAALLLANVLLDTNVLKQLKQYHQLLHRFLEDDPKAQKHFLGGVEQLIDRHKETLLPRAKFILKLLYDLDLVDEDVILAWAEKPSRKYVKKDLSKAIIKECDEVITWLQEAEEEESSTDDDGDIEFDERAREVGTVIVKQAPAAAAAASTATNGIAKKAAEEPVRVVVDGGEEIDIDDI